MSNRLEIKVWTIGHSTRSLEEFTELLAANGIEALADVRRYPASRKYPHFNEEALSKSLAAINIEYASFVGLGGRRRPRKDSRNTVWRSESFRGYADYMETVEFKEEIARLIELAGKKPTTFMCSEAVWWRCHRALISDYLKAAGIVVEHIIGLKKNEAHPFTSAARIVNGELSYRAEE